MGVEFNPRSVGRFPEVETQRLAGLLTLIMRTDRTDGRPAICSRRRSRGENRRVARKAGEGANEEWGEGGEEEVES